MAANTIRDIVDYTLKFKEQPLNEDAVKQAKKLVFRIRSAYRSPAGRSRRLPKYTAR